MVVACADFCFSVIAFQDEMDANKKKRRPRGGERKRKWVAEQKKLASSSPSERPSVLVNSLHLEVAKPIPDGGELRKIPANGKWEWERKIPAGGARGPGAGEISQNQHVL